MRIHFSYANLILKEFFSERRITKLIILVTNSYANIINEVVMT